MFTTIEGPHRVQWGGLVAVARASSTPRLCPNLRKVDMSSHSSWFAACRIRCDKTDLPMQEGIRQSHFIGRVSTTLSYLGYLCESNIDPLEPQGPA
ncbi:hypothetical protein QR685DRAFT_435819 [Neurospora intermedia]|uniref:Uncharacterized protein n=1 Tax=Neurospora intermedia TaxID=5142 RepID=A0ABR3DL92_NEUIN